MNFPLRFSIHGPDQNGTWSLMVYRFKWEMCPKEGSYVNHRGPFEFPTLRQVCAKVKEIQEEDKW